MLNNPSSNVIEFPIRSQYDLFIFIVPGSDETVAASTGIVGIGVEMLHRPCRACGSPNFIITSSAGPHHAGLRCIECHQHGGWLSVGAYTFVKTTVDKFGRPTEPITVRHSHQEEGF